MTTQKKLYALVSALFLNTAALANPEAAPPEPVTPESAAPAGTDQATEAAPAQSATSATRFADRCTNFTTNGWAFKSPRNFLKWLDVFSDPGIYLEFGRRGLDPDHWVASLDSLMDPGTPRNHLEWTNPAIYDEWAKAAAEPAFYTAVNSLLFDPGRMMRWVMLPIDGQAWSLLGTALNPNTWVKWLNAPQDAKTQALFAKAANPETARRWLEALGDPRNTPWLNPPTAAQTATRTAPQTTTRTPATARFSAPNPYLSQAPYRL